MITAVRTVGDAQRAFHEWYSVPNDDCPTYATLAAAIGNRPRLAELLLAAPPAQRIPVLLFACVHELVLDRPNAPLAAWYRNLGGTRQPSPELVVAFEQFVDEHEDDLRRLLAQRTTQTNEIGRCALFLPVLQRLAAEVSGPMALVDVGASAGLNLLIDRYDYRFGTADGSATVITGGSGIELACQVRRPPPLQPTIPSVARAVGIDPDPIDVADGRRARWLQACVWPDQPERFRRLAAAIELARDVGLDVRRGDATATTAAVVDEVAADGHPVVTNSWVLNYLSSAERQRYVAALDAIGARRDLSWIWAEEPFITAELPGAERRTRPGPTTVVLVTWRGGRRTAVHLADAHPHGRWIDWRHPAG